jgi:hypothetical protein
MLITARQVDPIGVWVDDYPVIFPFLDAVYAKAPDAFDLAEEWCTDLYYFKFMRDPRFMVYLPQDARERVRFAVDRLKLC